MKKTLIFLLSSLISLFSCKNSRLSRPYIDSIENIKIVISGDFMQHGSQIDSARVTIDSFAYDTQLRHIKKLWSGADFAIINLETTLSDNHRHYSGYPMFCAPAAALRALSRAGIDGVALANNHILDKRLAGIERTIKAIDDNGLSYAGIGFDTVKVMIIEAKKFQIALLNYTYSTNGMPIPDGVALGTLDTAVIAADIARVRGWGASHVIVFYHWGDEYLTYPSRLQRELALWSRASGADVVVGSHPHVVQPIDGVHKVVYSLGNFVSNQSIPGTDVGISVRLTFCSGVGEPRIEFLSHRVDITDKYTVVLTGAEVEKIVRKVVKYE